MSARRALRLDHLIPNGVMRSLAVTQNQIFIGAFNASKGIFVMNIWSGEEEPKEDPVRLDGDLDWY